MKTRYHIACSAGISLGMQMTMHSWPATLGCFFSGVLLDIDHYLEYYMLRKKFPCRYRDLLAYFWYNNETKVYLFLHAYELLLVYWAWVLLFSPGMVWLGLGVGLTTHLIFDQWTNPIKPLCYFLIWRMNKQFDKDKILSQKYFQRKNKPAPTAFVFIICAGGLIMSFGAAFSAPFSFVPPSGKTLLLVGQDRDTIARYVRQTGHIPGGTMLYTSIQKMEGLETPADVGSGPMDGNALLGVYPDSVVQIGLYMVDGLDDTIGGTYDAHLKELARWLKKAGRPVYLRIGYEFDNPQNHYEPLKYKKAFCYVVGFLRKEGVRNVAYVWHSYCWTQSSGQQWMDWYPGDDYVDWFGASIFSTPDQLWKASSFVTLARQHHKPFMIAESTPWGMYTIQGKVDFLKHVFRFIKDNNVEAFCYIDSNWDVMPMFKGQHIGDDRLEENPATKELWLKEISSDRYLNASPELFQSLGWKKSNP